MGFSICLILMLFNLVVTNFVTCVQPFACHDHERIALLEFKQSFVIDKNIASRSESAYPKVLQWKSEENNNCCSWDGIECDEENGHVVSLDLSSSCLFGSINSILSRHLTSLEHLHLSGVGLSSMLPDSFANLKSLASLALDDCELYGEFPVKVFQLSNLRFVDVSFNYNLTCHLPADFHYNGSLSVLGARRTGFAGCLNSIEMIESLEKLRGPLPIPPPSLMDYNASNNMLNGDISPVFCNLTSLQSLALSNNNLSGMIPQCFGNLSDSLSVLDLRNNSLHGNIPQTLCNDSSNLKLIDLSYNQLQGKLPRSLSKCLMLEGLALSNNQLIDVFPSWLGSLPELKVLTLRSNNLHGEIVGKPEKDSKYFPKLRVIDLSGNHFTGLLPYDYISHWDSMKTINIQRVDMYYNAIQDVLAFIDLSSNRFEGEIPKCIGNLEALRSLNLSNNMLTGRIPLSLGDLSVLESLDLSRNNLSGEIPQELKQLGFLSHFNVSHNNLRGSIPQGNQFNTMEQSCFEWNPSLCGDPLPKKCGYSQGWTPPSSSFEEDNDDLEISIKSDWKFVLAGFASGLVVGLVLGDVIIARSQTLTWLHYNNSYLLWQRKFVTES
ncbi:hypothetical protein FNV43_RR26701 [Rhamnella rubrinervis]|uniref:Leucine-rich repeat-containing N-terminal plant-type domain-containing protein n=1 Tax=Rhamnella rubrinervis TaxID=2594499 RepID=A0A8K0GRS8_9ROSA|nr:hypothetical protein FNV43_RR26701 [Rhamnella rubrinervis]